MSAFATSCKLSLLPVGGIDGKLCFLIFSDFNRSSFECILALSKSSSLVFRSFIWNQNIELFLCAHNSCNRQSNSLSDPVINVNGLIQSTYDLELVGAVQPQLFMSEYC